MKAPTQSRGGWDDVGSVPASVLAEKGVSLPVRRRFAGLARHCVEAAERVEMAGAALSLLSSFAVLGVRPEGGQA